MKDETKDNEAKDNDLLTRETNKYTKIWKVPEYSFWSQGVSEVRPFIEWAKKLPVKEVLVVGCGQGFELHYLEKAGFSVYGLDIVDVLKFKIFENRLTIAPVWSLPYKDLEFDAILCCDVLEHIPSEKIRLTLQEINRVGKYWYFSIACRPDKMGRKIGETLHLSVHPPNWWIRQITRHLTILNYSGGLANLSIKGTHKFEKEE